ncbi:unnamed protein product [Rotaria magnacalcarata]|uniref:Coiled-coil domain-containing protein 6 n=2 Tax=Rotaria magnacalcarata TaxID=392030 RepID=A0A816S4X3_9BILA|nr:unnamed protein product [Rotaria magnacalcarata]CAF1662211.1 unnamed protein product [Rotaria magnacalcarata]CAF1937658.1 unnamed protein product [Rotaria magnacalcarata]CAF2079555.1 unnamed protein product [Rotaria magnacalcarata]CAF2147567.1 unnamed protein product [Rotaria magnacalcarata]
MSAENTVHSMQTDSECESDVSSIADSSTANPNQLALNREHLMKRIDSLTQENRVLKVELETYKLRLKASQQEIKQLKHASVHMQAKAEQEEEFISNTLLKKIQELKKEKETLANNYEREEEFLTNDLSRKLQQLREEKQSLEQSLEQEQASQISKLMKRIKRLEAETVNKQNTLEQLKREKIELENTLEKEQESLVNRLWKRMEKLETDKRLLQLKLEQPDQTINSTNITCHPSSSIDSSIVNNNLSVAVSSSIISNDDISIRQDNNRSNSFVSSNINNRLSLPNVDYIQQLKKEVDKLKRELVHTQESHRQKMEQLVREEQDIKNENLRLQRKLQLEVDRREQLCRQLSESESSLEMDEERALNERMKAFPRQQRTSSSQQNLTRSRTVSSPSSNNNLINEHGSSTTNDFQRPRPPSASLDTNNQME